MIWNVIVMLYVQCLPITRRNNLAKELLGSRQTGRCTLQYSLSNCIPKLCYKNKLLLLCHAHLRIR